MAVVLNYVKTEMEQLVIEQITDYIKTIRETIRDDKEIKLLHNTNRYVEGYLAACDAIERIIKLGEKLAKQTKEGNE